MTEPIQVGDLTVEVVRKKIKNMYLSVHPEGRVPLAAPRHFSEAVLRAFALGKLDWVRKQQVRLQRNPPVAPCRYVDGEIHFVWGRACRLAVVERAGLPEVEWEPGASMVEGPGASAHPLTLRVRPRASRQRRAAALEACYREQLRAAAEPLIAHWEKQIGVKSRRLFVRRMRTRWGTCNTRAHTIRLNSELARRPPECLEYVIVHELVHLLEPSHNARFKALMDRFLPDWRERKQRLNRFSVGQEGAGMQPVSGTALAAGEPCMERERLRTGG